MAHDPPVTANPGAVARTSGYARQVFDSVSSLFENGGGFERTLAIAGHGIRIRYLDEKLESVLSKAFARPSAPDASGPALTIHVCDFESTSTAFPVPPWKMQSPASSGPRVQRPMLHFRDERFIGLYEPLSSLLSLLDTKNNQAVWCIPRQDLIPPYELSAPFRPVLHWWLGQRGLQIVHSAALANDATAILLAGPSGSGKSTTSLAALEAGLRYLGDDYVLVGDRPRPEAWGLYRTGKVFHGDFRAFPRLSDLVDDTCLLDDEKTIMYLGPTRLAPSDRGLPIGAILLPRVMDCPATRLVEVSPATCLAEMAPSTMLQLRGSGPADFERLGRLASSVPAFRMELGKDRRELQQALLDLIGSIQI